MGLCTRRERLRAALGRRKLSWLLVTNPSNVFYLTGFRGSAGLLLIGPDHASLWVDPRYTLQAVEQACEVEVREVRRSVFKAIGRCLRGKKVRALGYDDSHVTCRALTRLRGEIGGRVRLRPVGELVEELRLVKDESEVEQIRRAACLTVAALKQVLPQVKPGIRELELAAELDYRMRREGADGPAFETIVASGWRSALPHARASAKLLKKDELLILDVGATMQGYAADMTRTFFLGRPGPAVRHMFSAVGEAYGRALAGLRTGVRAGKVDAVARGYLREKGLFDYLAHGTGHGVGIDVHEGPRLGRGERTPLQPGCVVAVEPGVYIKGLGGVRLEDTVLVTAREPEVLTPFPKDGWIVA